MFSSVRIFVLVVLCLQNTVYTLCRRYSLGVLNEQYNKYEVLLVAEFVKILFSASMILSLPGYEKNVVQKFALMIMKSWKMCVLAGLYGAMNILSFVALRNIGAGMFTIFAQLKILSTAGFSALILQRRYSMTKWRALFSLILGVLLFSEPIWNNIMGTEHLESARPLLGTICVLTEITLSGFSSIYFEKVIKCDTEQYGIWERNFQLALWSFPLYITFILGGPGSDISSIGSGWSIMAFSLSLLGASGGLLVALSIKYGDSVLKTLATTSAIILSAVLDHFWLGGPLSIIMMIAAGQVIISIANYAFDQTPPDLPDPKKQSKLQPV